MGVRDRPIVKVVITAQWVGSQSPTRSRPQRRHYLGTVKAYEMLADLQAASVGVDADAAVTSPRAGRMGSSRATDLVAGMAARPTVRASPTVPRRPQQPTRPASAARRHRRERPRERCDRDRRAERRRRRETLSTRRERSEAMVRRKPRGLADCDTLVRRVAPRERPSGLSAHSKCALGSCGVRVTRN